MPDTLADLPDWPLLLDEDALAKLLSVKRAAIRKMVAAGTLPPARDIGGGLLRWHADEVRMAVARFYGLDGISRPQRAEREKALEALHDFDPKAKIRPDQAGPRPGIPLRGQGGSPPPAPRPDRV